MSFLIGLKHWAPFLVFSIILIVVPIVSGAPFYSGIIAWAVIFLILFIYATSEGIRVNYGYFAAYCESTRRLDGHCAIVTGANSGVGYATSKELIRRGCNVIITARSQSKIDKTIESINNELGITDNNNDSGGNNNKFGNIESVILDLSSKTSIDAAIDKIINQYCPKYDINILINNAGAWLTNASITKDGNIDTQWQANYFAPFYMTKKLLPYIKKAAQKLNHGRIINVTSSEHRRGNFTIFNGFLDHQSRSDLNFWKSQSTLDVYGNTKCAQIMHAAVLQAILDSETNNSNDSNDNNANNGDMSENEKKLDSYQNEAANGSNNNNNVLYIMAAHPGFVDSGFVNSKTRSLVVKIFYPLFVYPFFYSFAYLTNEQGAQTSLYCVLSDRKDIKPGGFHAHCEINDTHSNVENVISSKKDELYKVSSMIWEQQMP